MIFADNADKHPNFTSALVNWGLYRTLTVKLYYFATGL